MSEQFNCGTFKDPSEFPPDIRAMMDKDRAEAEREWTAEDRAELTALRAELAKIRALVAEQAEDAGLWFNPHTAPEAYQQQELRRLHALIEGRSQEECARDAIKRSAP